MNFRAEIDTQRLRTSDRLRLTASCVYGAGEQLKTLSNAAPWNLTGQPALSVPCGEIDGRPVGLKVIAEWYDKATAIALESALEELV